MYDWFFSASAFSFLGFFSSSKIVLSFSDFFIFFFHRNGCRTMNLILDKQNPIALFCVFVSIDGKVIVFMSVNFVCLQVLFVMCEYGEEHGGF